MTIGELVDTTLRAIWASTFSWDLNLDLILDVDDQLSPIVKVSDAWHYASTLFYYLITSI